MKQALERHKPDLKQAVVASDHSKGRLAQCNSTGAALQPGVVLTSAPFKKEELLANFPSGDQMANFLQ